MAYVPIRTIRMIDIDKFAFRAFNYLTYDCAISGLLIANTLLDFPKYYSSERAIKRVNLWVLCYRFSQVIFETVDKEDIVDSFVGFDKSPDIPSSIFDGYQFRGPELEIYLFYNYQRTIKLIITFTTKIDGNISFAQTHLNKKSKV